MKTTLILFESNYYLSFSKGKNVLLTTEKVKDFLKNYKSFCVADTIAPTETDISGGSVMAVVEDDDQLRICHPDLLNNIFCKDIDSYMTSDEYAEKHGRTQRLVIRLCGQGRIKGVIQKGSMWLIPKDAPYPADARFGARAQINPQRIEKR